MQIVIKAQGSRVRVKLYRTKDTKTNSNQAKVSKNAGLSNKKRYVKSIQVSLSPRRTDQSIYENHLVTFLGR